MDGAPSCPVQIWWPWFLSKCSQFSDWRSDQRRELPGALMGTAGVLGFTAWDGSKASSHQPFFGPAPQMPQPIFLGLICTHLPAHYISVPMEDLTFLLASGILWQVLESHATEEATQTQNGQRRILGIWSPMQRMIQEEACSERHTAPVRRWKVPRLLLLHLNPL